MTHDVKIFSDYTVTLNKGESKLIYIDGQLQTILLETFIDTGCAYVIKSFNVSTEVMESTVSLSSLPYEYIQNGLVSYSQLSIAIRNVFIAPNYIYIENTSTGNTKVTLNLRGNR